MTTGVFQVITSVWSSFGHHFLSTGETVDDASYERCLTCGAEYLLKPRYEDPGGGDYQTRSGDDPSECTGRTDLWHGEAPCQADTGHGCPASDDGPCLHLAAEHGCNCLICTG